MSPDTARAIYDQHSVKVIWYPPSAKQPDGHKSVKSHIPKNGILRPNQRPIPGHVPTTTAEYWATVALVRQAVAVLDREPPVATTEPDADQLPLWAAA